MSRLSDLHAAIAEGALELYYQPIVDLTGNEPRIVGAEALIRCRHPSRGLLEPESFLELAEDSRLIVAIDKWALFRTIHELADLITEFDLFLTMNVSAREFGDEDLPEIVQGALAQYPDVAPARIKLELTERGSMENPAASLGRMRQLHEMGTEIWIDDFGSGQSSLTYLKELPATTLKIDRNLIQGIESHENERRYLSGIVDTICARGKHIVVEGVESERQAQIVRELGCGFAQGYWFSRPVDSAALRELLREGIPGRAAACRRL
jgi:EAL domain-containing protein (putative c-di-GMP-specific phosphodiesterase class I)